MRGVIASWGGAAPSDRGPSAGGLGHLFWLRPYQHGSQEHASLGAHFQQIHRRLFLWEHERNCVFP